MRNKPFFSVAFLLWMIGVTFASLSSFEGTAFDKVSIPFLDKAVHFIFYFGATLLCAFFLREWKAGHIPIVRAVFISMCFALVYGIIIEVLQYTLTDHRKGDINDVLANAIGAFCGGLALKLLFSGQSRLNW